ncbi:MAG: hypothetical protein M1828_002482 [Chrysothrix sp. TS-e1954]|nr:MAG: hypothetical protein M1828_002482 [Chrysothrix sp. TS-e1954]
MPSAAPSSTPITTSLLLALLTTTLLTRLTSTAHLLPLLLDPHLISSHIPSDVDYDHTGKPGYSTTDPASRQLWRLLTYTLAYPTTTEVLFGSLALWNLRVIERLWGSRKILSFLLQITPLAGLVPPLVMICLRAASPSLMAESLNYIPAGPTALVFALLAQYHAAVPYAWRYRSEGVGTSEGEEVGSEEAAWITSKSTSYLLPAQLALSQLPGSAVVALCGWCIGYAWRLGLVWPGTGWRVPVSLMGR